MTLFSTEAMKAYFMEALSLQMPAEFGNFAGMFLYGTVLLFIPVGILLDRQFGLDGLTFTKKGELLVGDFGDAKVYKLKLSKSGEVLNTTLYAMFPNNAGIDGMIMDKSGNLYVAGFSQNQLLKVDKKGNTSVVVQYADNDGANGELDQPVDLVIYDSKLLISNFDLMVQKGMLNTKHSKPYTISYLDLNELN